MAMSRGSRETLGFFALTFAITEPCFIAAATMSRSIAPGASWGPAIGALVLLGTFAPGLVALALTARATGRAGVAVLLARMFRARVRARWYVFALGFMVGIRLAAAVLLRLATGAWPRFGDTPLLAATLFSVLVGGQAGEELGWRGYALPRLAEKFGLPGASVILGVLWACWHLPLYWFHGADKYGQSFVVSLLQVTALSVATAWLYWRSGGSLLLTMLMHAAINNTKDIVPTVPRMATNPFVISAPLSTWLGTAVLWVVAGVLLVRMKGARLDDHT
jgi:membrane protease YdiL (CAAX protease family)